MVSKINNKFDIPKISGLSASFFSDIEECHEDWLQAAFQGDNALQEVPFLSSIAENFENKMRQYYAIFYQEGRVVGRALFQCGIWEANASYKDEEKGKKQNFSLKNWFANKVKFNGILCGNILLTGEYGFNFDYDAIDKKKVSHIITQTAKGIEQKYYADSKLPTAIIAKDLVTTPHLNQDWTSLGYHRFEVQPNMVMDIDPAWSTFDDYLAKLTSKYRVRVKRAYKKSKEITRREFTEADIESNLELIFEHFISVQKNAGFNLVYLKPNYFLELKKRMGELFKLYGYFFEGKLIGFNTIILNHEELEAHYLGFDRDFNISHQLYLTMLYDKLKKAIAMKKKRIIFSRTAMEIKSSVGAEPVEMCIYLRHENTLLNKVVSPIISLLNPHETWVPRHPFKNKEV
jgi:hypothetical protein